MICIGRAGPADYGDPKEGGNKMFDRLKKDLGIRGLLAIELITAAIVFTGISMVKQVSIPEAFMGLATFAAGFYFGNRSTMDKPQ